MSKPIKLYLLTGFLGAGKTTFLTNVLEHLKDHKVGVIMNEFGKIGIDGTIIKKNGLELVEINRGSIFCSCLKINFATAMAEMADREMDYLFVESSGLADPANIGEILRGVAALKGDVYDYKGALCLVDAPNFLDQVKDLETVINQLKYCHLAIINKSDLVDNDTIETILDEVNKINPHVDTEIISFGESDCLFLEMDLMKNQWLDDGETSNTEETKPKTLNLTYEGSISKEELSQFINLISSDAYRIKGFCVLDNEWQQVDVVNRKIDYKATPHTSETSQLVIISKIGPNIIKPIFAAWQEVVGREMKLR